MQLQSFCSHKVKLEKQPHFYHVTADVNRSGLNMTGWPRGGQTEVIIFRIFVFDQNQQTDPTVQTIIPCVSKRVCTPLITKGLYQRRGVTGVFCLFCLFHFDPPRSLTVARNMVCEVTVTLTIDLCPPDSKHFIWKSKWMFMPNLRHQRTDNPKI